MLRIASYLFLAFLASSFFFSDAFAFRQTTRSTRLPTKSKENMNISWKERKQRILFDTVCFNYAPGDIKYRSCRQEARELFRERCDDFKTKYNKADYSARDSYKSEKEKYCDAAVR